MPAPHARALRLGIPSDSPVLFIYPSSVLTRAFYAMHMLAWDTNKIATAADVLAKYAVEGAPYSVGAKTISCLRYIAATYPAAAANPPTPY